MSFSAPSALFLVLSLVPLGTSCHEQQQEEARGLVFVEPANPERPDFYDFGGVQHGEHVEHTWVLENTDPVPVTIRDILSACTCTVPDIHYVDWEGNVVEGNVRERGKVLVVPPKAKVYITMKVDTAEVGVPNRDKLVMVRLRCDSVHSAFINFEMHLVVRLLFQATPAKVSLGQVARSAGGTGFTEIVATNKETPARVVSIESSDPEIQVDLTESVRFGVTLWTLTAKVPEGLPLGPYRSEVVLKTSDADGEGDSGRFQVNVGAQIMEDVVSDPATAALGSFSREEGRTIETRIRTLVPGHRLSLTGYTLSGEGAEELDVTLSAVMPDEEGRSREWIASLSVPAGASLDFYSGILTVELDDPQYPTLRIPYSGRVVAAQ